MTTRLRLAWILLPFLGACAALPPPGGSTVPGPGVPSPEPPPVYGPPAPESVPPDALPPPRSSPPDTPPPPPPATPSSTLLGQVDAAMAAGDLERAAALCERALRITPRDPFLWYRLAGIRYEQARYAEAAGVARRALSFAAADPVLRATIQSLLDRAEVAAGRQ